MAGIMLMARWRRRMLNWIARPRAVTRAARSPTQRAAAERVRDDHQDAGRSRPGWRARFAAARLSPEEDAGRSRAAKKGAALISTRVFATVVVSTARTKAEAELSENSPAKDQPGQADDGKLGPAAGTCEPARKAGGAVVEADQQAAPEHECHEIGRYQAEPAGCRRVTARTPATVISRPLAWSGSSRMPSRSAPRPRLAGRSSAGGARN